MNALIPKLRNRSVELTREYGSKLSVEYNLWHKYIKNFDINSWWGEYEPKYRNIGSFIQKKEFTDEDWKRLLDYAEKAFKPCIKDEVNLEEFVLDIIILMN